MDNKIKSSFVFLDYWCILFSNLPINESGELIKAIANYRLNKEVQELPPSINAQFLMIKAAIEHNDIKYAELCEKNRENIKKRYQGKKATSVYERIPKATSVYECIPIEDENENENEFENDFENDFLKKEEKEEKKIPLLEHDEIEKRLNEVLSDENIFIDASKKKINKKLFEDKYNELYPGDYIELLQVQNTAMNKEHNYVFSKK